MCGVDQRDGIGADVDDGDVPSNRGEPSRLEESSDLGDRRCSRDNRHAVPELVADQHPPRRRGRVVGVSADRY